MSILVLLGPSNRFGARYFRVYLVDEQGRPSDQAVVTGLYAAGTYPSHNWVEVMALAETLTFTPVTKQNSRGVDVEGRELERGLLQQLAGLIPPGGHMMIEYDSPGHRETARALELGVPAAATRLGHLLYRAGSGISFRDWYFAEGGSEGPRKLQGFKPLNKEHARERGQQMARELLDFVERRGASRDTTVEQAARQRAVDILATMDIEDAELGEEAQRLLAQG